MRVAIAAFALLLSASAASATTLAVAFDTPAQYAGAATQSNVTWAVLVFAPEDVATLNLEAPVVHVGFNHSAVRTKSDVLGISQSFDQPLQSAEQSWTGPMVAALQFEGTWSSVWIKGSGIRVVQADSTGRLLTATGERSVFGDRNGIPPGTTRGPTATGPAFESGPGPLSFEISGNISSIEWHNATTQCSNACPDGAKSTSVEAGGLLFSTTYFAEWTLDGNIVGTGTAHAIVSGGFGANLAIDGTLRLPRADSETCQNCKLDQNGTLSFTGQTELRGIKNSDGGRLSAGLAGSSQARLDETALNLPDWEAPAAGAAVVIVVGVLLWKLVLAGLVNRLADPLDNPTRRRIMDHIQDSPGVTCRELQRNLTLGNGTVIHHLHVLRRHKLISPQVDGNKQRLFENHGKYRDNWQLISLLRQTPHRELLGWISASKEVVQKQVLAWAAERGWKRTVTQARLQRLRQSGLVDVERHGRMQVYRAIQPPGLAPQPEVVDFSVA